MDREIAYAKINLALHVRRRRDDGYHDLETLFAFCADGDVLEADELLPGDSDALAGVGQWGLSRLEVVGQFADGIGAMADNSVLKAYNWLEPQMAVRFRLTKNLPVASGIGGGSADAASALRLIHRLWCGDQHVFHFQTETATSEWRYADGELDIRHAAFPGLGRALGADVPVCVHSQTARGEGIGEKLTLLGNLVTGMPILLINPGIPLSTAAVFKAWDEIDRGPLGEWREGRNDLEAPACALVPEIGVLLDWLKRRNEVTAARMSGSGATCFALFNSLDARDAVAEAARATFPGYWIMGSILR